VEPLHGETLADRKESVPKERGTFIVDADGCVFTYRSFRAQWLRLQAGELDEAIKALLGDTLSNPSLKKGHKDGPRGSHFPCIIGHQRQYQRVSLHVLKLTNAADAPEFLGRGSHCVPQKQPHESRSLYEGARHHSDKVSRSLQCFAPSLSHAHVADGWSRLCARFFLALRNASTNQLTGTRRGALSPSSACIGTYASTLCSPSRREYTVAPMRTEKT
jgi:hypothetical protein